MKIQVKENFGIRIVRLGLSRQVAIPKKIHDRLQLAPGDYLEVELRDGGVVFTPKVFIDRRINEGLEDVRRGRVSRSFASPREMIRSLRASRGRAAKK